MLHVRDELLSVSCSVPVRHRPLDWIATNAVHVCDLNVSDRLSEKKVETGKISLSNIS